MARTKSARAPVSEKAISPDYSYGPPQPQSKLTTPRHPRDYTSEGVKDNDVFLLPVSDYQIMIGVTIIAALVRLFRIYQPSSVVFDEVHFGGFASKYIKGRFFMDVHPPLAKLLITLFGWLAGFNGDFDFKDIGKDYLEPGVPYVAMRMFPAICGILLAPTMFLTLKATGCKTTTAVLGAGLIIFENGLLTQARLILLDSPLVIATAFTALSYVSFANQHELGPSKAFDLSWWIWLVMTGLGLGMTVSIKWVGLFAISWVGCLTLVHLWVLLGDTQNITPSTFAKHLLARVFCLIIIPLTFYVAMFAIHLTCLVNPGDGDGFMSSEFQSTLNSKGMRDVPVDVLMGSKVTIRHVNSQGGYLHSHPLMYPTGSKQQQITLYPHKDENNMWLIENQTQPLDIHGQPINGTKAWNNLPELPYMNDSGVIRLYHLVTHRRLHSHDVRPPVTEADWQNEVSAYGYEGFEGDANDLFRIQIAKKHSKRGPAQTRLRTIETKFRLIHIMTGCTLFSHAVKLPQWASEQQEVTCAKQGSLPNSLWYVEYNEHPSLGENAEKVNYRNPGFFGKFWELQKVMWRTNAGLVESHAWDSRPESWPILRRGINFWGKNRRQIYLIGNPLIWYSATLSVLVYVAFKGIAILRWQRNYNDYANVIFKRFDYEIGTSVLGWALHYFPFFLMKRQLFLHHYFPALYFAIMVLCQIFDFVTARIPGLGIKERPTLRRFGALGYLVLAMVTFALFSPLAYGNMWTKSECQRVKLFSIWDFECNAFPESYEAYSAIPTVSTSQTAAVQTPARPINAKEPPPLAPPLGERGAQQPLKGEAAPQPRDESISGPPMEAPQVVVQREEQVEYRDQDGNVMDADQVKSLEGKVQFKTRHETRTRIIDVNGNELPVPSSGAHDEGAEAIAPPHPGVEGVNRETRSDKIAKVEDSLAEAQESVAGQKEMEGKAAKPGSEKNEASAAEDL